jgi:arsenical pump membrane protein
MPALGTWLRWLFLPSLAALVLTFAALYLIFRGDLRGHAVALHDDDPAAPRTPAIVTLALAATALVIVSSAGGPLGYATLAVAVVASAVAFVHKRSSLVLIVQGIQWTIIPLTAAFFVIIAALDRIGGIALTRHIIESNSAFATGWIAALASNVFNNLPVGLNAGEALPVIHTTAQHAFSVLVGVNLGPNFTPGGSLATILWLSILRRAGIRVSVFQCIRVGLLTTPLALAAALLLVR